MNAERRAEEAPGGWMRQEPGETTDQFIARCASARPPLTDSEKAKLRAIFRAVPLPAPSTGAA